MFSLFCTHISYISLTLIESKSPNTSSNKSTILINQSNTGSISPLNSTHLGPQHVASDETLELLLGRAPCDSNSVIIPCTTFTSPKKAFFNIKFKFTTNHTKSNRNYAKFTFRKSRDCAESKIGHTLSKS